MFSAREIYIAADGWDVLPKVFPAILMEDPDDRFNPSILPDGSLMTYGGVKISNTREGRQPICVNFNRESRRALGELVFHLLEAKVRFSFKPVDQTHYEGGIFAADQGWVTPESLENMLYQFRSHLGIEELPLHPQLGRCAWDAKFREAHPELEWAFPLKRVRFIAEGVVTSEKVEEDYELPEDFDDNFDDSDPFENSGDLDESPVEGNNPSRLRPWKKVRFQPGPDWDDLDTSDTSDTSDASDDDSDTPCGVSLVMINPTTGERRQRQIAGSLEEFHELVANADPNSDDPVEQHLAKLRESGVLLDGSLS